MPRTMQQSKVTFVIRDDLLLQATGESEASTLTMAELIRRAIDLYLTQFPPPEEYATGDLLGEITGTDPTTGQPVTSYPTNKKYSIHINDGLLGELDRYALIMGQAPDEVVNRALMLYIASVKVRREAAEAFDLPPDLSAVGEGGYEPEDDSLTSTSDLPQEGDEDDAPTDTNDEALDHGSIPAADI